MSVTKREMSVWMRVFWAWPVVLAGCSFGPPNLGHILRHPIGKNYMTVMEVGYETIESYHRNHSWVPEDADGEMEFVDIRQAMAGVGSNDAFLYSFYLKDLFIHPGAGLGFRTDSFYGMGFLELTLMRKHEMGPSSPHLSWQMGWKPFRWMIATYDLFQIEFNDMEGNAYGWESFQTEEAWASRATFCLGILDLPISYNASFLFAHGINNVGFGGVLSLGI